MERITVRAIVSVMFMLSLIAGAPAHAEPFVVVKDGQAMCDIVVDTRGSLMSRVDWEQETRWQKSKTRRGLDYYLLLSTWAEFLSSRLGVSSGAKIPVLIDAKPGRPAIIISLAENYPDIAANAGLSFAARDQDPITHCDAFCIATTKDRLYLLGHTDLATRHAVAELLRQLGHRFYNPSPRWWVAPQKRDIIADINTAYVPQFFSSVIGGASGHDCSDAVFGGLPTGVLWDEDNRWGSANQHSGNYMGSLRLYNIPCFKLMVLTHRADFAEHPEWFAVSKEGNRDTNNLGSLCVSNPELIQYIVNNRVKELQALRKLYRVYPAITIEGSSGCQCPECTQFANDHDLLFSFYNKVAKGVRDEIPDAYVTVRSWQAQPPSFELEKNIIVQVPKGYLEQWKPRAAFLKIGDGWGGFVPGADAAHDPEYHQKWIPYYLDHNVRGVIIDTPGYWGALTPSVYIGFQLLRDRTVNVEALLEEYYALCFGKAAPHLKDLQEKNRAAPALTRDNLLPRFRDLELAYRVEEDADIRKRIIDLMSYYHFLLLWHEKDLIKERQGGRDDVYWHQGVLPVMRFASRTRYRQMLCLTYVTASLCFRDALADKRMDFYSNYRLMNWIQAKKEPIWSHPDLPVLDPRAGFTMFDDPGLLETFNDDEVLALFREDLKRLTKELGQ